MNLTLEIPIHFSRDKAGKKTLESGYKASNKKAPEQIPRIARLMALAIHFDNLVRKKTVRDYADLARLGGVSRARMTQIMNLLNLSPEIQEKLLFTKDTSLKERNLRPLTDEVDWSVQKKKLQSYT